MLSTSYIAYYIGDLGVACVLGRLDSEELVGLHGVLFGVDPFTLPMVVENGRL